MLEISTYEAESTLGPLLDRVQSGEQILITRQGKTVARLVPEAEQVKVDHAKVAAAAERIRERALRAGYRFNFEEFKQDRDTGRR